MRALGGTGLGGGGLPLSSLSGTLKYLVEIWDTISTREINQSQLKEMSVLLKELDVLLDEMATEPHSWASKQKAVSDLKRALLLDIVNPSRETVKNIKSKIPKLLDSLGGCSRESLGIIKNCYLATRRYLNSENPKRELILNLNARTQANQMVLRSVSELLQKYEKDGTPLIGAEYRRQKIAVLTALKLVLENEKNVMECQY